MTNWLPLLGLPLAVYVLLAIIPSGRMAFWASLVVALGLALAWAALVLDVGQISADGQSGTFLLIGVVGVTIAWALATTLQLLRMRLPRSWPAWAWPACVVITALVAAIPILRFFGG